MSAGTTQWSAPGPLGWGQPLPTSYVQPQPVYRDQLDARRAAARLPEAEYPYGYLGDVHSRREDRLTQALSRRMNARSYTRGVHVGSRAHPTDYVWPEEFNPMSGLQAQAAGMRQRPLLEHSPHGNHLVAEGKLAPRGARSFGPQDPERGVAQWRPTWS